MAIGALVNALMGPNSSFPEPVMPQLNVSRNSLTSLGIFLHNYQFQIMRLIPFISRLADLLQRESLMPNPRDRLQTQAIANCVGQALHEIVYATAPIAHLVRDIQIGDEPGNFRMINRPNPDLVPFAASLLVPEAGGVRAEVQPAITVIVAEQPLARQVEERMPEHIEKDVIENLNKFKGELNKISSIPKTEFENMGVTKSRTLADFISARIDQVISQKNWHAKVRDLLPEGNHPPDQAHEKILLEVLSALPIHEAYELYKGNFEAIIVMLPTILRIIVTIAGGQLNAETRKELVKIVLEKLKHCLIIPPAILTQILPGFEPYNAIENILDRGLNEIIHEFFDYDRHRDRVRLGGRLKYLVINTISEIFKELTEGFSDEVKHVKHFIKHNIGVLLRKFDLDGLGNLLDKLFTDYISELFDKAYEMNKKEEKKEVTEKPKPKEEEKKFVPPKEVLKDISKETKSEPAPKIQEEVRKTEVVKPVPIKPTTQEPEEKKIVSAAMPQAPQSPQAPQAKIPEKWHETIEKDMKNQENLPKQAPFSHAYLVTDSKRSVQDIPKIKESLLKKTIKEVLTSKNIDKEDIADTIADIDDDLEKVYAEYVRMEFEKRIKDDPDYNPERYGYLDKFVTKNKDESK